jgi:hypothetical protein
MLFPDEGIGRDREERRKVLGSQWAKLQEFADESGLPVKGHDIHRQDG